MLHDLEVGETLIAEMKWGIRYDIMRVPTGWIYQPINRPVNGKDEYLNPVFVPISI
jgi:hypothetical protein